MSFDSAENKVVIRRRIAATPEELFDAWTDADGMREWMCPGNIQSVEVRMEPRVGGALLIIMHDGDRHDAMPERRAPKSRDLRAPPISEWSADQRPHELC